MNRRTFLSSSMGLALAGCGRSAGPWPSREIKLVVQAAPGGLSDSVSRIAAGLMEKRLAVPVVCENRPGAAGALAFSYVVRRPADGYTIGHAAVEIAMVRALGYADVGPEQMDLLCLVAKTQPALAVHADSPWRSLRQFLDDARVHPGRYVLANSGTGSIWHVNALLLERAAGIRVVHCPFAGSTGALTSLLGRHVDGAVAGVGEAAPHAAAGRVRVLAVFDRERPRAFPDVPSTGEQGLDFGAGAWSGFFGPQGLPEVVRRRLVEAVRAAFDTPDFTKLCEERGMTPVFQDSAAFGAFAREQARFFASTLPALMRGAA